MGKIVLDSERLEDRLFEANEREGRVGHLNMFIWRGKPPKRMRVEDTDGNLIGRATLFKDHGKDDPRAKGVIEYLIRFFGR